MVEDYVMDLKKRVSPNSVPTYIYGIQAFFDSNDIDLKWKKIRRLYPGKIKVSGTKPYTTKQVQLMLAYTTSLRNKTVIHFMAASGVRVGAISDLRLKHLRDMPIECKAITVYEGDLEEYTTFLTPEASEILDQYFEQRKRDGESFHDESPVFREDYKIGIQKPKPMSRKSIINMIERIVRNAGIRGVKHGSRYETQLDHGFRKRFDTIMALNVAIKESISEKMMGHADGVRGRYVRPDIDKLFGEYKKAIPELTISDQERLQIENQQKQKELDDLGKNSPAFQEITKRLDDVENGLKARNQKYFETMYKTRNNPMYQTFAVISKILFEMSYSEDKKRKIWKKIQDALEKGKEINFSLFSDPKELSLENLKSSLPKTKSEQ